MIYEYLFLFTNIIFWGTLGATEGFKWTPKPNMVTSKNYHVFRAFTNGAFLVALGLAPAVLTGLVIKVLIFKLFVITCASWPVYEMILNYVNHGAFIHQKSDFVFGDITFKHPPVILIPILSVIALVTFIYLTHFK